MSKELQPDRTRLHMVLGLAAAAGGLLSGCIMVPTGRHYDSRAPEPEDDEVVTVAPPPPQVEVVVAAPGPGFFWIAGHWAWIGGRHAWIGGRWEGYRPGWRWSPFAWVPHRRGWRRNPGRWQRN